MSIAPVNIALNAAVANALNDIATELEASVAGGTDLNTALQELLPRLFKEHQPVVFNANNYASTWPKEAAARKLPNLANSVDALERYSDPEVMNVFLRQGVLSEREIHSRQEILFEGYAKTVCIEGNVLANMVNSIVLPAAYKAQASMADVVVKTKAVLGDKGAKAEEEAFTALRNHIVALQKAVAKLEKSVSKAEGSEAGLEMAKVARDAILPAMEECRTHADALEKLVDDNTWPLPKYAELLWLH
jgi:glutamine synthetase